MPRRRRGKIDKEHCALDAKKAPLAWRAGSLAFDTSRITGVGCLAGPRARPRTLTAARGNGSHRSLVDPKERWFSEATFHRPLTSRAAVLFQLEQR